MEASAGGSIIQKYFRIHGKDIALLKFILEGYDGLAVITTLNSTVSYIQVATSADFSDDVDEIIKAIDREYSFPGFEQMECVPPQC